jgi:hypothetical protein
MKDLRVVMPPPIMAGENALTLVDANKQMYIMHMNIIILVVVTVVATFFVMFLVCPFG